VVGFHHSHDLIKGESPHVESLYILRRCHDMWNPTQASHSFFGLYLHYRYEIYRASFLRGYQSLLHSKRWSKNVWSLVDILKSKVACQGSSRISIRARPLNQAAMLEGLDEVRHVASVTIVYRACSSSSPCEDLTRPYDELLPAGLG
jgi:hypothetical protein